MAAHNGEIVEKVIRREGHSLTDLAKITGVNRRSIYNWFLQPRLKPEIIIRIGRAIKHDFSVEFPGEFLPEDFVVPAEVKSAANDEDDETLNVWKEKYIDLLERYNYLLSAKQGLVPMIGSESFNVCFVNDKCNEYQIDLRNEPTALFLDKCKRAGYRVKSINRGELTGLKHDQQVTHHSATEKIC